MCRPFACLGLLLGLAVGTACSSSPATSTETPPVAPTAPALDPHGPLDTAPEAATEIVVAVDAEPFENEGMPIAALDLVTTIDGVASHERVDATKGPLFPHELRLTAPKDKLDAVVTIEARALDSELSLGSSMVVRTATTRFVKHTTKLAYLLLEIRCNHVPLGGGSTPNGPTCDAPLTCIGGACASADLPPLGDYRKDWATNPPSACGTGTPEIALGQGEQTFQALADGDTLAVEEGPQCGHHVWLSLRMKNLAQTGTISTITAVQPGGSKMVPATAFPNAWGFSGGDSCDLTGLRFQLDLVPKIDDFLGKALDITVEARDKAGHVAKTVRHLNVAPTFTTVPGRNCSGGGGPNVDGPNGG